MMISSIDPTEDRILDLKMATLGAFWTLFITVHTGAEGWVWGGFFIFVLK